MVQDAREILKPILPQKKRSFHQEEKSFRQQTEYKFWEENCKMLLWVHSLKWYFSLDTLGA